MPHYTSLINTENILDLGASRFQEAALWLFRYQYEGNELYRSYCDALRVTPDMVTDITDIPFLPVSFFKTHRVVTHHTHASAQLTFESSGTTGEQTSRHHVMDADIYERSLLMGFNESYGAPSHYAILALLPSYLERQNASLVHMAKTLMEHGGHADNGFYINEWDKLSATLARLERQGQKTLLLGVTFALLDFADAHPMPLRHTTVMETGGMKGRRAELTRAEVHDLLKTAWALPVIHSEYGMTELLSQAYAASDGVFSCSSTMRVLVRDINDPLDTRACGQGCVNVIDLANIHSCAFIATEDIGHLSPDGSFTVLGRMDHSALRGCSLMAV